MAVGRELLRAGVGYVSRAAYEIVRAELSTGNLGGSSRSFARGNRFRGHGHAGTNALQAIDDDLVASLEAVANDALSLNRAAHGRRARQLPGRESEDDF